VFTESSPNNACSFSRQLHSNDTTCYNIFTICSAYLLCFIVTSGSKIFRDREPPSNTLHTQRIVTSPHLNYLHIKLTTDSNKAIYLKCLCLYHVNKMCNICYSAKVIPVISRGGQQGCETSRLRHFPRQSAHIWP
jgi:hypothetical protein